MRNVRSIVFAGRTEVGCAVLGPLDPSMGVYGGTFEPTLAYSAIASTIQHLTKLILEASPDDPAFANAYAARDALGLRVETEAGLELHPETVHIVDASALLPEERLAIENGTLASACRLAPRPLGGQCRWKSPYRTRSSCVRCRRVMLKSCSRWSTETAPTCELGCHGWT